jgi:hypothetical protein
VAGAVSIRGRLRRLEELSEGPVVVIPQPDGPPARFPESALKDAFLTNMRRLRGEDVPEHPLSIAAVRSGDPKWVGAFFACVEVSEEVPDLSE